jgi:hypothetical protein
MSRLFIVLWMIFFHVIADYNLQGWLASAKQKSYWEQNAPDKMYEHDYITALIMHSFGWSFMVMLPIAYVQSFDVRFNFFILFVLNIVIHAFVDDLKANKKLINLYQDQFIHMLHIFLTSLLLYI